MTELTNRITRYERGEMNHDEFLALVQELYCSGLVWNLQGHYGRTCYNLLEEGLIIA